MKWYPDNEPLDSIIGYALFKRGEWRAYIHDNGGGSWIVNAGGYFVGWAKDEDEARKMAEARIAEIDKENEARRPKHPRGPRGPHSYGRE